MPYDRTAVAAYFDQLGEGEWQRFDKYALGAVHEHIHNLYLERFVRPGSRVLEIGAGPGRFTQTLHRIGCRIVVADISDVQLALNRRYGSERRRGVREAGHLRSESAAGVEL
jgi:2-polyprenyl-3-methyl-5-hydroxy-6-metoxy-1,4-benzoquinol methylase